MKFYNEHSKPEYSIVPLHPAFTGTHTIFRDGVPVKVLPITRRQRQGFDCFSLWHGNRTIFTAPKQEEEKQVVNNNRPVP